MAKKMATFSNDEEIWELLKLISEVHDNSMAKVLKILIKKEADRLKIKLSDSKK